MSPGARRKQYDRGYFDHWYRDQRTRVVTPAALARRVAWTVTTAEYVLGRPIRSVLDVGCGEGHWAPVVRRLRPRARYLGVDPSAYAVARFGRRRRIRHGTIESLDTLGLGGPFDLVVCCAMLNYLEPRAVAAGLEQVGKLVGGVAHVEIFARGDPVEGDFAGWRWYSRDWVRRAARRAHLVPVGLHCYVPAERAVELCALERSD